MRPLAEQTILITGATDGLGRALASALAKAGPTLLIHGRDEARGQATLAQIEAASGNEALRWLRADLSSLAEVRELAQRIAEECDRLDVLVNNAGIGTTLPGDGRRMQSRDGYELRFAVNYLARASSPRSCSRSTSPRSSTGVWSAPPACTPGPTCRPRWSTRPASSP